MKTKHKQGLAQFPDSEYIITVPLTDTFCLLVGEKIPHIYKHVLIPHPYEITTCFFVLKLQSRHPHSSRKMIPAKKAAGQF